MAVTAAAPSREDFASMLEESFTQGNLHEGSVIKGTVVAIEKDMAVIDVGLKTEGRVAVREFTGPGRQGELKVGDEVEVYLERVENALGEAVLSRDKARREESWGKLEKAFQGNEKVQGVIFNQVKGGFTVDLDGAVAFLPRSQVDIRPIRDVTPADERAAAVPDPQDGSPPRQHRRLAPHRAGRDPRRAAPGAGAEPRRGPGHRRRGQEHHRLRRVRRSRRHRRPAARHRHRVAARQSPVRGAQHRPAGQGQDHQDQPRDPPHLARHEAAAGRSVAGHRGQVPGRHPLQGPRHQHHRLRRVRRARARHRGPDPRLRDVVDQEERASRQDRLDLAGGRGADPRGRSGQAPHLARPQADHAQSVGGLRREVSARHRSSRARSRTRPSSACSSASTATSTAWSTSPISTGSVRASR